jgi:hypothetical protein
LSANDNQIEKIPQSLLECQNLIFFQVNTLKKTYPKLNEIIQKNINEENQIEEYSESVFTDDSFSSETILTEYSIFEDTYLSNIFSSDSDNDIFPEMNEDTYEAISNIFLDFDIYGEIIRNDSIRYINNQKKINLIDDVDPITLESLKKGMEVCQCQQCQKYFEINGFKFWIKKDFQNNHKTSCPYCRFIFPSKEFEILTFY